MWKLASAFFWLLVSLIHATFYLLGLTPDFLVSSMATSLKLSTTTVDKIRRFLGLEEPHVGDLADLAFQLPVFVRKDGTIIRLGQLVDKGGQIYVVKHIMAESSEVSLSLGQLVEGDDIQVVEEETVCQVGEVKLVENRKSVVISVARDGMDIVAKTIFSYPVGIQRLVRRHQLASLLRREVQRFLAGFSSAGTLRLGGVDWRLDPGILGLERDTEFSLEYRVEKFVSQVSHLDLLLGDGWDVRQVKGTTGFRLILTLELIVDLGQELIARVDATFCPTKPDGFGSCRAYCLQSVRRGSNQQILPSISVQTGDRRDSNCCLTAGQGVTLAWDEFQINSADNSPGRQIVQSATVSMDDLMFTGSLPGLPGTSTAFNTLDKLLSAIPQSRLVFDSPIQEVAGERFEMSKGSSSGPNTSTPADELDQDTSSLSRVLVGGRSRGSSPRLPPEETTRIDDTKGVDSCTLEKTKENHIDGYIMRKILNHEETEVESMQMSPDNISEHVDDNDDLDRQYVNDVKIDPRPSNIDFLELEHISSLDVVSEYIKSLPPTEVDELLQSIPSPVQSKPELDASCEVEDEMNLSVNSSQSRTSHGSSQMGSRFIRGMFQGTGISSQPCPFPDEWQFNVIPESIENDEDID